MGNATVNLSLVKSGYVRSDYPTTVFPTNAGAEYLVREGGVISETLRLYFGFQSVSSSIANRRLYDFRLRIQGMRSYCYFTPNVKDFDPATLTYENAPREAVPYTWWRADFPFSSYEDSWAVNNFGTFSSSKSAAVRAAVLYGLQTDPPSSDHWLKTVLAGGGTPYLEITYDDSVNVQSQITVSSGPTSGYVNPRNTVEFSWWFSRKSTESYYCVGNFTQASAALKWRVSGGIWNTVNASSSTPKITLAANTFPTAATIEWYLTGTDTAGTSSETPHYTISTAAGTANAKAISPVSSVEDGSQPITLRWELSSTDGQTPAAIDLWWKLPETSSQNWTVILNHAAAKTSHTVDAGYFPAGECQWMVRGYNVDDVPGPWSYINGVSENYPSFVCVAAPDAPAGLQATQVPRTTVSWQSEDQEAYEIEIDGIIARKAFGTSVNSWQVQEPLEDGTHSIRVRVQGVYGLWSAWSETTVIVANDPPTTAELDGRFDTDAELIFSPAAVPDPLIIHWYRDGKRIARTVGTPVFADRLVLGYHSYYAEIWYDSGYYVRSNTVMGTLCSRCTRIASTDYGSPWIKLQLSDNSNNAQAFSWSRDTSLRQVLGARFPVLELSEFENLTGSYSCAFPDTEGVKDLEALKGRTVIVKSRGGRVLIGALSSLNVNMKNFFISCSFTIRQIEWEDFVSYDPNA